MIGVRALTLRTDEDLALFCSYLAHERIGHRVFEEQGQQVLEVATQTDAERVRADYAAWRGGSLVIEWTGQPPAARRPWRAIARRYPVVASLLALAVVCFPATLPLANGSLGTLLPWLTIVPISGDLNDLHAGTLHSVIMGGQWWRFVTPVFVHFGFVHLAFNAAVVVEFGRRIEQGGGTFAMLLLTATLAIVSNLMQFLTTHAALFGGLSGVAYGLFAYVAVRGRFDRVPIWHVNPAFSVAVLVILVVMTSGVTEIFDVRIANAAHWTGLTLGAAAALAWRPTRKPKQAVA